MKKINHCPCFRDEKIQARGIKSLVQGYTIVSSRSKFEPGEFSSRIYSLNHFVRSTLPNAFYGCCISIPQSVKNGTREDNYRVVSLINITAKIVSQIFANKIQQHIKKYKYKYKYKYIYIYIYLYHNRVWKYQECKSTGWFNNRILLILFTILINHWRNIA